MIFILEYNYNTEVWTADGGFSQWFITNFIENVAPHDWDNTVIVCSY